MSKSDDVSNFLWPDLVDFQASGATPSSLDDQGFRSVSRMTLAPPLDVSRSVGGSSFDAGRSFGEDSFFGATQFNATQNFDQYLFSVTEDQPKEEEILPKKDSVETRLENFLDKMQDQKLSFSRYFETDYSGRQYFKPEHLRLLLLYLKKSSNVLKDLCSIFEDGLFLDNTVHLQEIYRNAYNCEICAKKLNEIIDDTLQVYNDSGLAQVNLKNVQIFQNFISEDINPKIKKLWKELESKKNEDSQNSEKNKSLRSILKKRITHSGDMDVESEISTEDEEEESSRYVKREQKLQERAMIKKEMALRIEEEALRLRAQEQNDDRHNKKRKVSFNKEVAIKEIPARDEINDADIRARREARRMAKIEARRSEAQMDINETEADLVLARQEFELAKVSFVASGVRDGYLSAEIAGIERELKIFEHELGLGGFDQPPPSLQVRKKDANETDAEIAKKLQEKEWEIIK